MSHKAIDFMLAQIQMGNLSPLTSMQLQQLLKLKEIGIHDVELSHLTVNTTFTS